MVRGNAWCVELVEGQTPRRHLGSRVERNPDFLAEGAWAGEFSAKGLLTAPFRCGSGVVFAEDRIHLIGPSHPVEAVYCFMARGRVLVSNSLHMLIAHDPSARPDDIGKMRAAAVTAMKGKLAYERVIYETPTGAMYRLVYGSYDIDLKTLALSETTMIGRATPEFRDYGGYLALVLDRLGRLVANARAPERRYAYGDVISTCSSGYDSASCAVLAKALGATEALTIRSGRGGANDSGAAVAAALNLRCHEYPRFGDGIEAQPEVGKDFWLDARRSSFEPDLGGRILLTGFHGDKAWGRDCPSGPMVVRGDQSGTGMDEFRKRVGFVHVPVPFIGVENYRELAALFDAPEMQNYHVAGTYDRPVPRRIVEDAGVPRAAFGKRKLAASVLLAHVSAARAAAFDAVVEEYRKGLAASAGEAAGAEVDALQLAAAQE